MTSTAPVRRIRPLSIVPLAEHPRWVAALEQLRALEARFRLAEERAQSARARLRGQTSVLRTATAGEEERQAETVRRAEDAERARALAEGRELSIPLPPQLDLDAALEEQRLLGSLVVEARTALEQLRCELDAEASRQMAPELLATYGPMLKALEDLHRAHRLWCECVGRLQGLGYRPNANVAPIFHMPHVSVLGDPERPDTIAGKFRLWLEQLP